ncbi:MAG: T9SS type A sorting domain-containing protein [Bacteroidetes bacterium]|nr:T9SS type A sorting domain-containing protein [Bacteroidota bacterium]
MKTRLFWIAGLLSASLQGQGWQNMGPFTGWPGQFLRDGNKLYGGGEGAVYESNDRGVTFSRISNNLPYLNGDGKIEHLFKDGNTLLAVSRRFGLYTTTSGNHTWKFNTDTLFKDYNYVKIFKAGNVLFISDQTQLHKSYNSGTGWIRCKKPFNDIRYIGFRQGRLFAVSLYYPYSYAVSKDTGKTWTSLSTMPSQGISSLYEMGNSLLAYDGFLYKSSDTGKSWTQIGKVAVGQEPLVQDGNRLYVSTGGNLNTDFYTYTDGDTGLRSIRGNLPTDGQNNVFFVSGDSITVYKTNAVYRTNNRGGSWTNVSSENKFLAYQPWGMLARDTVLHYSAGFYGFRADGHGLNFKLSNYSWQDKVIDYTAREQDLEVFACNPSIYYTKYYSPKLVGWNITSGYAFKFHVLNNQIYGITGESIGRFIKGSSVWQDITGSANVLVADIEQFNDSLYLLQSGSGSWYVQIRDTSLAGSWKYKSGSSFSSENPVLLKYFNGHFYKTTALGVYKSANRCKTFYPACKEIKSRKIYVMELFADTLYAGTDSGLYFITKSDSVWKLFGNLHGLHVFKISKNKSHLFASTNEGLYRFDYSFFNSVKESGKTEQNRNTLFYPNPFENRIAWSPELNIENLELYSLTGVRIGVEVDVKSRSVVTSHLHPGVYIVRANLAGGFVLNVRMVKGE